MKNIKLSQDEIVLAIQTLEGEQERVSNVAMGDNGLWIDEDMFHHYQNLENLVEKLRQPQKEITIVIWYGDHHENDVLNALNTNNPNADFDYTALTFSENDEKAYDILNHAMMETNSPSHCMLVHMPLGESECKIKKTFDTHNFPALQTLIKEVHEEKEFEVELKQVVEYGKKIKIKASNEQEALKIAHKMGKYEGEQSLDLDQYETIEVIGGCYDNATEISK